MGLNRKRKFFFFILVCMLRFFSPAYAMQTPKIWNDNQWKDAKKGLDYTDPDAEKEKANEPVKVDEEDIPASRDHFDLSNFLHGIFTSPPGKVVAILFILALLIYTIMRVMVARGVIQDSGIGKAGILNIDSAEENLAESDLDKFLRNALDSGDYKMAIRILYLMVIQQLNENTWILWKKNKTNMDYLQEMRTRKSYSQFRSITLAYELVWYGDTNISRSEYENLQRIFSHYKMTINGTEGV